MLSAILCPQIHQKTCAHTDVERVESSEFHAGIFLAKLLDRRFEILESARKLGRKSNVQYILSLFEKRLESVEIYLLI